MESYDSKNKKEEKKETVEFETETLDLNDLNVPIIIESEPAELQTIKKICNDYLEYLEKEIKEIVTNQLASDFIIDRLENKESYDKFLYPKEQEPRYKWRSLILEDDALKYFCDKYVVIKEFLNSSSKNKNANEMVHDFFNKNIIRKAKQDEFEKKVSKSEEFSIIKLKIICNNYLNSKELSDEITLNFTYKKELKYSIGKLNFTFEYKTIDAQESFKELVGHIQNTIKEVQDKALEENNNLKPATLAAIKNSVINNILAVSKHGEGMRTLVDKYLTMTELKNSLDEKNPSSEKINNFKKIFEARPKSAFRDSIAAKVVSSIFAILSSLVLGPALANQLHNKIWKGPSTAEKTDEKIKKELKTHKKNNL